MGGEHAERPIDGDHQRAGSPLESRPGTGGVQAPRPGLDDVLASGAFGLRSRRQVVEAGPSIVRRPNQRRRGSMVDTDNPNPARRGPRAIPRRMRRQWRHRTRERVAVTVEGHGDRAVTHPNLNGLWASSSGDRESNRMRLGKSHAVAQVQNDRCARADLRRPHTVTRIGVEPVLLDGGCEPRGELVVEPVLDLREAERRHRADRSRRLGPCRPRSRGQSDQRRPCVETCGSADDQGGLGSGPDSRACACRSMPRSPPRGTRSGRTMVTEPRVLAVNGRGHSGRERQSP